jgi:hypothetical protein
MSDIKEAPKKIVLTLTGMASPKPGTLFWLKNGEIRNAVIDFGGLKFPCYDREDDPEDGNKELIEAAKEVLNHASGKSIDGTERPLTDEEGCLANWMEVLEMVREALMSKAGAL